MEFLLFSGMIVLVVLVFDSRKTIQHLRTRIDTLEHSREGFSRGDNLQPATDSGAKAVPETIFAKRSDPAERLAARRPEPPKPPPATHEIPEEQPRNEPAKPTPSASKRFEDLIGGKLPIWIGGIALIFAGFFLVRFSIEAGLFGPATRSITATLFGLLLIGLAEFGNRIPRFGNIFKDDLRIGHSIAGAGIAVLYATLYMASELYGLLGLTAALLGVSAITILAFLLSLKHGPPTAIMGLLGGFAAPYVAGLGPESIAPLLIYLGVFTAGLFGLAIHRGWAWLALLATGGGVIWSSALLFTDVAGDIPLVGAFILLLAIGGVLTLTRTDQNFGLPRPAIRSIPLIVGLIQLYALAPLIDFSLMGWLFFAILAVFAIALAWRDEDMIPAPAGALGLALAMVAVALADYEPDQSDLVPLIGLAALFGIPGHIFALRPKSGFLWALIGLAAPTGMLVLAAMLGNFGWSDNIWGLACLLVAMTTALMAWRTRLADNAIVMPLASAITAILLTIALWLWTPEKLAAIIVVAVAGGLAAWARYSGNRSVSREAAAATIFGGLIAAFFSAEIVGALFASLEGATDLYRHLPHVGPMILELLVPSLAIVALSYGIRETFGQRLALSAGTIGMIGAGAFAYLLFKQALAIGPSDQFAQYGFVERAALTHLLALTGWLLLRRTWRAEWVAAATRLGWSLAGIALFRFVYFDLILLSPTSIKQALGPAPIANLGTLHYTVAAFWFWAFSHVASARQIAARWHKWLDAGSLLAAIAAVMITVRQAVHGSDIATPAFSSAETYLYSAGLMLLAIAWLARGIQTSNALLRIAGLLLLTLVTFKVFLIDAAQLEGILRILSFLGLGIALIGIGWIYGKIMRRDAKIADAAEAA